MNVKDTDVSNARWALLKLCPSPPPGIPSLSLPHGPAPPAGEWLLFTCSLAATGTHSSHLWYLLPSFPSRRDRIASYELKFNSRQNPEPLVMHIGKDCSSLWLYISFRKMPRAKKLFLIPLSLILSKSCEFYLQNMYWIPTLDTTLVIINGSINRFSIISFVSTFASLSLSPKIKSSPPPN